MRSHVQPRVVRGEAGRGPPVGSMFQFGDYGRLVGRAPASVSANAPEHPSRMSVAFQAPRARPGGVAARGDAAAAVVPPRPLFGGGGGPGARPPPGSRAAIDGLLRGMRRGGGAEVAEDWEEAEEVDSDGVDEEEEVCPAL